GPTADHGSRRGRHRRRREPQRHSEDDPDPVARPRPGLRGQGARDAHVHVRGGLRARDGRARRRQHGLGLPSADLALRDEGRAGSRTGAAARQPARLLPAAGGDRLLRPAAFDGDAEQRRLGRRRADVRAADAAARRPARHRVVQAVPARDTIRGVARLPAHARGLGAGDPGDLGLRAVHLDTARSGVPGLPAARRGEPVAAAVRRAAPLAALAGVAALVGLPFLGSIGPDEGGYAYVAWEWARGHTLYSGVWVDRPQGLILVYRLLISISQSAWAIRLGAVVAGVAITLLLVWVGRLLDGERAGLLAGGLFAVARARAHLAGVTVD